MDGANNMQQHFIEYGEQTLTLDIPGERLAFEIGPRELPIGLGEQDQRAAIRTALAEPIGSPRLAQIVQPGQKVMIIVDDHTRLTPTKLILPLILEELAAGGVNQSDIEIMIAGGTHRAMTETEKQQKLGRAVLDQIKVHDHDSLNNAKLLDYGTTDRGTHILVNADAMQADIRLVIGTIFPHFPAGWSAGAKMLLPGIAGAETVAQFHLLGSVHQDTQLGQVETVTRQEMESFARHVGLQFIFNVVLDKHGRLLRAFAGDFVAAHRAGVAFARTVYEVEVSEPADIVISSTSPIDHDYFQAMKGLYSAAVCARPGGEIVLVSPLYEGMAATHLEALDVMPLAMGDALTKIRNGAFDDHVGAAIATYQIKLRDAFTLTVVSENITQEMARKLGVNWISDPGALQTRIEHRLRENNDLKIGIMHQSTEVLPRVAQPKNIHGC
jgi:nickel-dependent lactate racemase